MILREQQNFTERVLEVAKIAVVFGAAFALIVAASNVLLLIFAGILIAIFLSSLSAWFSRLTKISYGWALGAVCVFFLSVSVATGLVAAPSIARQMTDLAEELPRSVEHIRGKLEQYPWANSLMQQADPEAVIGSGRAVIGRATGVLSGFLGGIASLVIVAFVGLYGAFEPGIYRRGFLFLVPKKKRQRVSEVLGELNETLLWWLIGKIISMSIIGVMTTLGLWLLDVPLALILGLIAAVLTFIPNIGPLLSAVPALLLGLTDGVDTTLYIALLYLGIQTVESYLITPLIQRRTIHLPPALTLSSQAVLGVLLGGIGVAMATPLTAAAIVVTKRLYVEDALGEDLSRDKPS